MSLTTIETKPYVLYANDWARFNAFPHFNTNNKSALEFAGKLHRLGIKNYAFFLALYNRELEFVDPYDPDLTSRERLLILNECLANPWYYLRECSKIPMSSGSGLKFYRFNRQNVGGMWCFLNSVPSTIIQLRQTGKSLFLRRVFQWLMLRKSKYNFVTANGKLMGEFLSDMKNELLALPEPIRLLTNTDVANGERIIISANGARLLGHKPRDNAYDANNLGRGLTSPVTIWDEGPFSTNIDISMNVILSTMNDAIRDAKSMDLPYGKLFTTTAGDLTSKEGRYFYENFVMGCARWHESYYDCANRQELFDRVTGNTTNGGGPHMLLEFNHTQLGISDEELHFLIKESKATGRKVDMDYFNCWDNSGESSSIYDEETAMRIGRSKTQPVYVEPIDKLYDLKWMIEKQHIDAYMHGNAVVIGLDSSDAVQKDSVSYFGINAATGEQVFLLKANSANIFMFANFIADMMIKYPKTILIPESRSSGKSIIDILIVRLVKAGMNPFKRIFNWLTEEYDSLPQNLKDAVRSDRGFYTAEEYTPYKAKFGFSTSGAGAQARSKLYVEAFNYALSELIPTLRFPELVDELIGLESKNNRIDHKAGKHDDCVVAWLLCVWFLTKVKNLRYYGINPFNILLPQTDEKSEEASAIQMRNHLKGIIAHLAEKANGEANTVIRGRILARIDMLKEELHELGESITGIAGLIEKIRQ